MNPIKAKLAVSILSVFLGFTSTARAGEIDNSGNFWLEKCESPSGSFNSGLCFGYIIGMMDGTSYGISSAWAKASVQSKDVKVSDLFTISPYCIPEGVTNGQLKDVFIKYLRLNPERRHLLADGLLVNAFAAAYPCR
ncbi:Rap1a/Tai family immunity protein [Achromobacter denitrificans]|uniref:Rap1a/Tai family immunity protein n=1 Tax=Achromobacter denitrificans TaxID=32002 RepID=UPI0011250A10|nr:Rap1a/Tai family immunity protein [Achromobacter denitrificans]